MDELTPEQEEEVAATVGAIQRIAMAIVALPKEQRAVHYALVRWKFEAAMREFGIEAYVAGQDDERHTFTSEALYGPTAGCSSSGDLQDPAERWRRLASAGVARQRTVPGFGKGAGRAPRLGSGRPPGGP
jgi:hypothetical protein